MKHIYKFKLNEFHPGADSISNTINRFIGYGEVEGTSLEITREAISLLLNYYFNQEIEPDVIRGSELHTALLNIENCINTLQDDGYPESWIYKELRKFV